MIDATLPTAAFPAYVLTADAGEGWDALATDELVAAFKTHGAILLRGFASDMDGFRALTARLCSGSAFNESPDRRLFDAERNIQGVNGGADAFPLHPELSREPWRPDACFFYCIDAPKAQGQTTICDGVALAAALPATVREGLAGRRLVYRRPASLDALETWLGTSSPSDAQLANPPADCPYAFERDDETIYRAFSRPALQPTAFGDAPAFANFLLFSAFYNNRPHFPALDDGSPVPTEWLEAIRAAAEPLTVPVGWQDGDLVILDNSRFMHGRTAILDPDHRQIATFFGYVDFAPKSPEEPANPRWRGAYFMPPAQGRLVGATSAAA